MSPLPLISHQKPSLTKGLALLFFKYIQMNYSRNTLLVMPYTNVPKQWSGDEPGVTQDPLAGAAAPLAQAPNIDTPGAVPPKGTVSSPREASGQLHRGPHPAPIST